MTRTIPWPEAIEHAVFQARLSPCCKSKRGAAIVLLGQVVAAGHNYLPARLACTGDDACRAACGKRCVHAEVDALRQLPKSSGLVELVHVKVNAEGEPVPGGGPSCWQCARDLLDDGRVKAVWLLHAEGWRRYPITEFYALTMVECGLIPQAGEGQ